MGGWSDLLGMAIGAGINSIAKDYQKFKLEKADEINIIFSTQSDCFRIIENKAEALKILCQRIAQYMGIEIKKEYNGILFKLFFEEAIGSARGGRSEEISILENFALYNGNFIVMQGIWGMGNGGISIVGEGCFELAQQIVELLKQLQFEGVQYVDGPINYHEKTALFAAVNELIANSEEYLEGEEEEEEDENEEDEEDEDDSDEGEDDEYEPEENSKETYISLSFPSIWRGNKQTDDFKNNIFFDINRRTICEIMGISNDDIYKINKNTKDVSKVFTNTGRFVADIEEKAVNESGRTYNFYWGNIYYNGKNVVVQGLSRNWEGGFTVYGEENIKLSNLIIIGLENIAYFKNIKYVDKEVKYHNYEKLLEAGKSMIDKTDEYLAKNPRKGNKFTEVFFKTPLINCGKCGCRSCFDFAGAVFREVGQIKAKTIADCPYTGSSKSKNKKKEDKSNNEIIELCNFFKIEYSTLDKATLKMNYRNMMSQYHPDKVNNLAVDFKELADKKTKEINEKYEILLAFLDQRDK